MRVIAGNTTRARAQHACFMLIFVNLARKKSDYTAIAQLCIYLRQSRIRNDGTFYDLIDNWQSSIN